MAHAIVEGRVRDQEVNQETDSASLAKALEELAEQGWRPHDMTSFLVDAQEKAELATKVFLEKYLGKLTDIQTEVSGQLIFDVRDRPGDVDYIVVTGTADIVGMMGNKRVGVDWKGLDVDTPILTTWGWKRMGDLAVGNRVFDRDGLPTMVTGVSEVKHLDCYEVRFRNGETVVCDEEHLWTLEDGDVIPVAEMVKGDRVPVAQPVIGMTTGFHVHPWLLGFWLGDGSKRNGCVTKSDDSRCWDKIKSLGYELGKPSRKGDAKCVTRTILGLAPKLRSIEQIHSKHIPADVMKWTVRDRQLLVQGLCDSDGSWNRLRKQAVWSTVDKVMADDMFSLLASLGEKPYRISVQRQGFGLTVTAHEVIWTPRHFNPFLCEKGDHVTPRRTTHNAVHIVDAVTEVESRSTVCIKVDSPSSTFLCGKALIPTHNTGSSMTEPWVTQRYGVQNRAYSAMFELDEFYVEYVYALFKGHWVAKRFGGTTVCVSTPEARAVYLQHLQMEMLPIAEALLRSTDPEDHAIHPTDWHCGKWCNVFLNKHCIGANTEIPWVAAEHEKVAKGEGGIIMVPLPERRKT